MNWSSASRWLTLVLFAAHGCAYQVPDGDGIEVDGTGQALDGEEVIEVMSCSPGYLQLGEGSSMTCIADPSWSGYGDDPLGGDFGDEFGGGGAKPGKPTKPARRPPQSPRAPGERSCQPRDLNTPAARECVAKLEDDLMNDHAYTHRVVCYRNGTKACCVEPLDGAPPGLGPFCDPIE